MQAGHRHESQHFELTLDAVKVVGPRRVMRLRPKRLGADKGYSYERIRQWCRHKRIRASIPLRSDEKTRLRAKGQRLPAFDRKVYRGRNVIERLIGRLKEFRAVATRYDKLASTFLAGVTLALIVTTLHLEY